MSDQSTAKPKGRMLTWALWGAALIGVAAVLYITAQASRKPPEVHTGPEPATASADKSDPLRKLTHPADGQPPPAYVFKDASGKDVTLADFKGKVVVANLWATWCAPCKIEMPTLATLAREYAGKPVAVVAISIDKPEALDEAKRFIAAQAPLAFYNDPEAKLPWEIKPTAQGVPTTIIFGKDGLERGRVSSDADWAGEGARKIVDKALAG
ncbi:TlpA family protein disulfide reductase [Phenylobacterium soli]|uniref:TlpA family protein disulfide reductase n=1 Tax=Phenylobacterium soli TaxID=2170551 RepID=A0A328AB80_9CAUL|nr:TlpA disulfide reductase family protein [Phenylobacterium soli]RAK51835.1 TlpA family protein disulfide reductase [Phenylobacterium soli]